MEVTLFQGDCSCIPELGHHRRKNLQCDGDGGQSLGRLFGRENIKRQRGEGQDKDPKEACVEITNNWGKNKREKDRTIQSPGTPSISNDSVRLEE